MSRMQTPYENVRTLLLEERFRELVAGTFGYHQDGADPWFISCPPDPDGNIDARHLIESIKLPTTYIDVQVRLVRRLQLEQRNGGGPRE